MKTYAQRVLEKQKANAEMQAAATPKPAPKKMAKVSALTGIPAGNLSNRDVANKKRNDERAVITRRSKKLKVSLPSLGKWGEDV